MANQQKPVNERQQSKGQKGSRGLEKSEGGGPDLTGFYLTDSEFDEREFKVCWQMEKTVASKRSLVKWK